MLLKHQVEENIKTAFEKEAREVYGKETVERWLKLGIRCKLFEIIAMTDTDSWRYILINANQADCECLKSITWKYLTDEERAYLNQMTKELTE